jgi:hypothetical protein
VIWRLDIEVPNTERRTTHMYERTKTILLASLDPDLTTLRKRVLEIAGYRVIAVKSTAQIASSCRNEKIDLVLIGSSLSPAEKRTFWAESRNYCRCLFLELYSDGPPELMDDPRTYVHHPLTSVDFVEAVKAVMILGREACYNRGSSVVA